MANQTYGINLLLNAEKQAKEKVNEARKAKARRLKLAKEEANAEIKIFIEEAENEFKLHKENMKGSSSDMEQRQAQSEEQEKARIEEQTAANKQAVVDRIIELVCSVQPKLHVNFKPTQAA